MVSENTINHIFSPRSLDKHKLKDLLKAFSGDKKSAATAICEAIQKSADDGRIIGTFKTTVVVKNTHIVVIGKIINGVAKIGTAFVE